MSMRHFFFYIGIACVSGALIGVAVKVMSWSDGVTFAVGVIVATAIATMAVRESLFEGFRRPAHKQRHGRHA